MKLGGSGEGGSHALPLIVNCRSENQIISCRPERWALQVILLYYPSRREQGFRALLATAPPMTGSHISANEKPLYIELPRFGQRPFCL